MAVGVGGRLLSTFGKGKRGAMAKWKCSIIQISAPKLFPRLCLEKGRSHFLYFFLSPRPAQWLECGR